MGVTVLTLRAVEIMLTYSNMPITAVIRSKVAAARAKLR